MTTSPCSDCSSSESSSEPSFPRGSLRHYIYTGMPDLLLSLWVSESKSISDGVGEVAVDGGGFLPSFPCGVNALCWVPCQVSFWVFGPAPVSGAVVAGSAAGV